MTGITASAPGKVVLTGEYAVLDKSPAICMAVDRRARVHVEPFDRDWHRIAAPGHTNIEGRFRTRSGRIEWLRGEEAFGLVDAVMEGVASLPQTSLSIELDTRAFHDAVSGKKLGLGSSAALSVALLAALTRGTDVLDGAMDAHRRLQQGAGSGVDVAAAVRGGLIEYRRQDRVITPLSWPAGLHYRLLWSGVPSDTRQKLSRYAAACYRESQEQLASAAEEIAVAWRAGVDVLNAFPPYIESLRRFSVDHGLGIFDAGHDRLATDAAAAGLVYKPCGAGGGDIGILLGPSDTALDAFIADGRMQLECELEPLGVTLEQH